MWAGSLRCVVMPFGSLPGGLADPSRRGLRVGRAGEKLAGSARLLAARGPPRSDQHDRRHHRRRRRFHDQGYPALLVRKCRPAGGVHEQWRAGCRSGGQDAGEVDPAGHEHAKAERPGSHASGYARCQAMQARRSSFSRYVASPTRRRPPSRQGRPCTLQNRSNPWRYLKRFCPTSTSTRSTRRGSSRQRNASGRWDGRIESKTSPGS